MVLETTSRIGDTTRHALIFQDDSLLASGKEEARGLMIICLQESGGEFMTILAAIADLGTAKAEDTAVRVARPPTTVRRKFIAKPFLTFRGAEALLPARLQLLRRGRRSGAGSVSSKP